jgi:hypothetical protein
VTEKRNEPEKGGTKGNPSHHDDKRKARWGGAAEESKEEYGSGCRDGPEE